MELMIVVAIIGIIAGIVAPRIMGGLDKAKRTKALAEIKSFETALGMFKIDNGFYPSTQQGLEALVAAPTVEPLARHWKEGGYLDKIRVPLDAWGHPYIYTCPGAHGDFDIESYGIDGEEGGEGKNADIRSWEVEE
jgi:general secretion pathway protein G